jgi:hypothetical protein
MPSCIVLNSDVALHFTFSFRTIPVFKVQLITLTLHPSLFLSYTNIIGEFKSLIVNGLTLLMSANPGFTKQPAPRRARQFRKLNLIFLNDFI